MRLGGLCVVLGEGSGEEGGDHAAALLAGMGQHIAYEVHAAALPGCVEDVGDGGFQPLVGIGNDQLDPAQAAPGQLAQELDTRFTTSGLMECDTRPVRPELIFQR